MHSFYTPHWRCGMLDYNKTWHVKHYMWDHDFVHPCEKLIGFFFRIEFDRDHCILIDCVWYVLKDPLKEIKSVKYLSAVISMSRVMKHWKKARCQFCDVKFGHRIVEAVDLFDYRMRISNQITFNFTNRRRKGVVPRFVDFVLHKWYSRKLYIIK